MTFGMMFISNTIRNSKKKVQQSVDLVMTDLPVPSLLAVSGEERIFSSV